MLLDDLSSRGEATQPCVLIVDDDKLVRLVGRAAVEQSGFVVREAETGEAAMEVCLDQPPDIVLLDVRLPGMDGFETCRRLRRSSLGRHLPVVMLTGLDDLRSIEQAYQAGATDFAVKPVNWTILCHRLEYMLRASRSEARLRQSEAQLANAQRIARLGYWEWDRTSRVFSASEETLSIVGRHAEDLATLDAFVGCIHPDEREDFEALISDLATGSEPEERECRVLRPDGSERVFRQRAEACCDGDGRFVGIMATLQDVSAYRKAERRATFLAHYDPVTGLPNRRSLVSHLGTLIDEAARAGRRLAVLSLDIDRFKRINETLGYRAGDDMLQLVAERLVSSVRVSDVIGRSSTTRLPVNVARFGGDEFIVVVPDLVDVENATAVARRLARTVGEPFEQDGQAVALTTSIGIAVFPQNGVDAVSLLRSAATAMNHVKAAGGDAYRFYAESMNSDGRERLDLEAALRRAIERGELELFYQPQYDLQSRQMLSVEALLRWNHPRLGQIPPGKFIPVAEESGLISELGDWVLDEVCGQLMAWKEQGLERIRVGVNLAGRQFRDPEFVDRLRQRIERAELPRGCIDLELTESTLMESGNASVETLRRLKELGLGLAIDDFGVGFSSLNYLRDFPVDCLKIDRGFVRGLPDRREDVSITHAIIALAKSLHLRVVAEGVENEQQLDFLDRAGCDLIQGFLLARPMPAAELTARLCRNRVSERSPAVA